MSGDRRQALRRFALYGLASNLALVEDNVVIQFSGIVS